MKYKRRNHQIRDEYEVGACDRDRSVDGRTLSSRTEEACEETKNKGHESKDTRTKNTNQAKTPDTEKQHTLRGYRNKGIGKMTRLEQRGHKK